MIDNRQYLEKLVKGEEVSTKDLFSATFYEKFDLDKKGYNKIINQIMTDFDNLNDVPFERGLVIFEDLIFYVYKILTHFERKNKKKKFIEYYTQKLDELDLNLMDGLLIQEGVLPPKEEIQENLSFLLSNQELSDKIKLLEEKEEN